MSRASSTSQRLKEAVRRSAPFAPILLRWAREFLRPQRLDPDSLRVYEALFPPPTDPTVLAGPFAGMRYPTLASGSTLLPKLVGTYEMELHGVISAILATRYERIVNIGAAEGYYAVGLARAAPGWPPVVAFDTEIVARRRLRRLAASNGVEDRIEVRGACQPKDLRELVGSGTLVLSDCEGAEDELLDPTKVPSLQDADLLVELHGHRDPGLPQRVVDRFRASHRVELIVPAPRDLSRHPELCRLSEADRALAAAERRAGTEIWAWATSRAGGGATAGRAADRP
ncbi:MAG TPA: hypothetical protein VMV46_03820 [Thermoanaerobaculia bacterium]|nr:hypothetical protein [Thermoanaerobaculia bacterium]